MSRPRCRTAIGITSAFTAFVIGLVAAAATTGPAVGATSRRGLPGSAPRAPTVAAHRLVPMGSSYAFRLTYQGWHRSYLLHVPPAAATGRRLPLVLNLHGSTQNAELQELQSGMDANADRNGYLVAYPNGTRVSKVLTPDPVAGQAQYSWNAGSCCGLPVTRRIDDVGFLRRVIAGVAARTPVDLRRVYVTGMSSGGMMAYAMAAEDAGQIAAIASVSGQVELPSIRPTRPVPTLEFHSVDDPVALWSGSPPGTPGQRYSVMDGISKWVRADRCAPASKSSSPLVGAPGTPSAGETATLVTHSGCSHGVEVALWRFTGSGHVWPGAPFNTGPPSTWILQGVGRGTLLVDANQTMWDFFKRFRLRATRT